MTYLGSNDVSMTFFENLFWFNSDSVYDLSFCCTCDQIHITSDITVTISLKKYHLIIEKTRCGVLW